MRPNSAQLADCADRFLKRIAIREEVVAARKAALQKPIKWTNDEIFKRQLANYCAKRLMSAKLGISEISCSEHQQRSITVEYAGGVEITVSELHFGPFLDAIKRRETAEEEYDAAKSQACDQLEALAKLKKVQGINGFRSYIRARWDALDGEVLLSETEMRGLFDEFIASQSAFTCKI